MPYLVRNLRLGLDDPEEKLVDALAERLQVPPAAVRTYAVVRRSVDARKKDVHFSYQVEVALDEPEQKQRARLKKLRPNDAVWLEPRPSLEVIIGDEPSDHRPIVVGFGEADSVVIHGEVGTSEIAGNRLDPTVVEEIYARTGRVRRVDVRLARP